MKKLIFIVPSSFLTIFILIRIFMFLLYRMTLRHSQENNNNIFSINNRKDRIDKTFLIYPIFLFLILFVFISFIL